MNTFPQVNLEHFQNLVALAYSDSDISQEEMKFLSNRAAIYGVSDKKMCEIIGKAKNIEMDYTVIISKKEKQLFDFIYMSVMDGVFRTNEYELCLRLGEKLGFGKKTVEDIIYRFQKNGWCIIT